jgi:acyl-coenzyme A synthetase/AMP-(fatty) acid ligase
MIEHQSLVNFTKLAIAQYQMTTSDRFLQFVSISFDVAAHEIYTTLCSGATLVLRTEEMISSIPSFVQKSQDWQITVWDLPTAYWHLLINELVKSKVALPDSLRLIIIGGERVQPELVRMWFKNVGNFPELINAYGPTEGTIEVSICHLSQLTESQRNRTEIPIGKSLGENISVYVLDETLKIVPPETPGEIYIGGAAVARGYLNRPELTAEKFIQAPFNPLERLYKTGDLGRYLPDGNIEFLGREDFQVKINGYRIELGEIESTLKQHPAIQEAIVTAIGESRENQQLIAYILPKEHHNFSSFEKIEFKLQQPGLRNTEAKKQSIELPQPEFNEELTQAYLQRQSYRKFLEKPISFKDFSRLISCLMQIKLENSPLPKYRYASAGSLYPVQTYCYIKPNAIAEITPGIYYYNPVEHRLILIQENAQIDSKIYKWKCVS